MNPQPRNKKMHTFGNMCFPKGRDRTVVLHLSIFSLFWEETSELMQNVIQNGKRALSVAVAATTMLFSVGAGLLQPSVAAAASAGDLIKGTSLSAVYYYGYDGMRYTFPNEKTYMTWYSDFSGVTTISDVALADLSLAGNVVYRPGSYWVKIQSNNKVYAVSTNGDLHWIESEAVASAYAGSSWASRVQDIPDIFFSDYSEKTSLMTASAFEGMLFVDGGNYYVAKSGAKQMVSSAGRSANGLQTAFFLTGTGIDSSSLTAGTDITSSVSSLVDAAQTVTDSPSVTGGVSISLASSTAAAATVPDEASGINVATFKITAGDAASIDVMNVALMGLAATATVASGGVYLYEGSERLTDGKSFNSSTREASFGSLNLDFAAGETRYISVVVDMGSNDLSTTFSVGLSSSADIEASGTVSGTFPISGSTMSVINSAVGIVTITDTGSLTNPVLGEQDATISKFKLAVDSTEDVSLDHITLKIGGTSGSTDHSDFQLYQSTTWLAAGTNIGNDLVLFDLATPFSIDKGADRTFTVTADIGGSAAETITVYLDNSADLYVVGNDYGFGTGVVRTGFDGTSGNLSTTTIQGGDLTASFSGPSATDVSDTTQNFSLFEGTLVADRAMTITAMPMSLTAGSTTNLMSQPISDIRIVDADTGALLMGPLDLATSSSSDTTQALAFTDDFDMTAGEVLNFKVTADMETPSAASQTFTLTMDLTSGLTAEDSNGDSITSVIPTTDLAGNAQTVVVSGLTVTLASTPVGTKTYVRGTTDVTMASFNFAAANGGAIEVTDFSPIIAVNENNYDTDFAAGREDDEDVSADGTYVNSTDNITSCSLYDGTTLVSGPESIAAALTGVVNFADFSYSISAGTTKTLSVHCNLANVAQGGSNSSNQYAVGIPLAADVTALDTEGDSATVTLTTVNLVSNVPTVIVKVVNSGSLAVTAASDTASADFLLTGSASNTVSKFRFDATNEAFVVDRLTVEEAQGAADGAAVGAYANNISLVTVSYPDSTGTTQTATGALTSNGLTLNGLTFYVGKDSHAEVTVKIDVPSTDRSGGSATSNERVRMVLDDGTGELRAVGQGSGQTLSDSTITTVDTAGSTMSKFVIREAKPTIALNSSSPSGAKVAGDQEVLRFNVSASSNEDVALNNIIFTMSSSDKGLSNWNQCGTTLATDFHLYNLNKLGTATSLDAASSEWTMLSSTGATCSGADVAFVKLTLATPEVIPFNTTYSYSLYFNSNGAATDDSVQFGIAADPITSAYVDSTLTVNGTIAATVTALVASGSGLAVGDVIYTGASTERALVTAVSGSTATILRGYLGTTPAAMTTTNAIYRLPSALLWQDDGTGATPSTPLQEYYGAHLVKSLPLVGNALSF